MQGNEAVFYGKVMLFGEYSVIHNSMALTIPYSHFNGQLSFVHEDKYTDIEFAHNSNLQLYHYLGYLRRLKKNGNLRCGFDLERFSAELDKGLYFESSIPQGYGVGSSGALVAALYHRYVRDKIRIGGQYQHHDIIRLKQQLASLETFYHGTSSGLDPLNAYLKRPVLIKSKEEIDIIKIPVTNDYPDGAVFLIDTGTTGETAPLVNIFMERTSHSGRNAIDANRFTELVNQAIRAIVHAQDAGFFEALHQLSGFELEHLRPMIPDGYRRLWRKGLEENNFYLKLCGSGGGGFLLGFTKDYPQMAHYLRKKDINPIPVFKYNQREAIG